MYSGSPIDPAPLLADSNPYADKSGMSSFAKTSIALGPLPVPDPFVSGPSITPVMTSLVRGSALGRKLMLGSEDLLGSKLGDELTLGSDDLLGSSDGSLLGWLLGWDDTLGSRLGSLLGWDDTLGSKLGSLLGSLLGVSEGADDGADEGSLDTVGESVGDVVGDVVGISVLIQRGRRFCCSDRPWPPPLQLSPCQLLILL